MCVSSRLQLRGRPGEPPRPLRTFRASSAVARGRPLWIFLAGLGHSGLPAAGKAEVRPGRNKGPGAVSAEGEGRRRAAPAGARAVASFPPGEAAAEGTCKYGRVFGSAGCLEPRTECKGNRRLSSSRIFLEESLLSTSSTSRCTPENASPPAQQREERRPEVWGSGISAFGPRPQRPHFRPAGPSPRRLPHLHLSRRLRTEPLARRPGRGILRGHPDGSGPKRCLSGLRVTLSGPVAVRRPGEARGRVAGDPAKA
ncbi:uncharacterized protein LOC106009628 isoform X2 [Heterocephalus glaber]|uniref:Uncharacterized protein LOC106009628 isoform X2 n=1 Tax=Heterocephalus glaber TaxID=10181 RepID=A0AAX6T991_HETGA|nr:uncharacterized protein LOC106009628 isoform X2 [Heterocephalus glaber]